EAVRRLGLALVAGSLGDRGIGPLDRVHEDGGEATLKALVGQVSDPGHLLGPNRMREDHGLRSPKESWCSLTRSRDQPRLTSGEVSKKLCPRLSPQREGSEGGVSC